MFYVDVELQMRLVCVEGGSLNIQDQIKCRLIIKLIRFLLIVSGQEKCKLNNHSNIRL